LTASETGPVAEEAPGTSPLTVPVTPDTRPLNGLGAVVAGGVVGAAAGEVVGGVVGIGSSEVRVVPTHLRLSAASACAENNDDGGQACPAAGVVEA
jgi:hypothetical protein